MKKQLAKFSRNRNDFLVSDAKVCISANSKRIKLLMWYNTEWAPLWHSTQRKPFFLHQEPVDQPASKLNRPWNTRLNLNTKKFIIDILHYEKQMQFELESLKFYIKISNGQVLEQILFIIKQHKYYDWQEDGMVLRPYIMGAWSGLFKFDMDWKLTQVNSMKCLKHVFRWASSLRLTIFWKCEW